MRDLFGGSFSHLGFKLHNKTLTSNISYNVCLNQLAIKLIPVNQFNQASLIEQSVNQFKSSSLGWEAFKWSGKVIGIETTPYFRMLPSLNPGTDFRRLIVNILTVVF